MRLAVETNTREILARLVRDGWRNIGGTKHDRFGHPRHPGVIITVARHREQTPGVARQIAKAADWVEVAP